MRIPHPGDVSSIEQLAEALDAASHEQRLAWAHQIPIQQFWTLFDLAHGNAVEPEYFLYDGGTRPRIHDGVNTMPPFRRFEKRFARVGDDIVGYNHARGLGRAVVWFQGHGPFTLTPSPHVEGEVWIDYRRAPAQHPDFPPVKKPWGTRYVVYGDMIDVMRRVSNDVTIGTTAEKGVPVGVDSKFILVRQP